MPICPTCRGTFSDDVSRCPVDDEPLLPDEAFRGADPDLPAGSMVGEYRVESRLGAGAFGTVYRAVHPLIGKTAAVKVLSRQWSSNPQMVSRFIAEARATNQIHHKNIIDIFAFGALPDGRQYYVMELLEGQPFDQFLSDRGRLAPGTALPVLRGVARALDAAHAQGIIHRDLKPENVYLVFDEDGSIQPKLLDFGIAKLLGEPAASHKTRTGAPLGTPSYMSPEQCHGRPVDARTDIYSLGVMAHEVLTGHRPFDGESVMDVLVKHMSVAPPPMTVHCPELPPSLDAPVLRMLAKEPGDRPASAGEAIEALVAAAEQAGIAIGARASVASPKLPIASVRPSAAATVPFPRRAASDSERPGRTFMGAERDVPHRPGRRTLLLVAGVAAIGVTAGAAGVVMATRSSAPARPDLAVTSHPSTSVPAGSQATSLPSAVVRLDILVTVESNVPGASVWLGANRLGDTSSPVHLPRGADKLTLTIKADGYAPSTVDVVPSEDVVVAVKLAKPATVGVPAASTARRVSKDLENPF